MLGALVHLGFDRVHDAVIMGRQGLPVLDSSGHDGVIAIVLRRKPSGNLMNYDDLRGSISFVMRTSVRTAEK